MSALVASRYVLVPEGTAKKQTYPLAAGQKVWKNGLACYDTANPGAVVNGAPGSATLVPIGWWAEDYDNSAGVTSIPAGVNLFRERPLAYWDSVTGGGAITTANLFQLVYIASDHELTTVSTGASPYGRVWALSPQGYPGGIGVEAVY